MHRHVDICCAWRRVSGRLETPALIGRKRDGQELQPRELAALVGGYLDGSVSEAQMAAFLMAGVLRGFTPSEAATLTELYVSSGRQVDLSTLPGPTVDKHSTGGVGDTTTLVVAPLAAACGLQVAKLSGRGLGHTGGTLDKLESIPGLRVDLSARQVLDQVEAIGLAVAAATSDLVPADKRIYALRDVTGTVPSPALIAASVMSKKIAGGARHILLDVKVGDGAFVETLDEARELARSCVAIGEAHGRRTAALLTDMSQPLGDAVGNALEVAAAVDVLRGTGQGRLAQLCVELTASLLLLAGASQDREEAVGAVEATLREGRALERFREFVVAQGGDGRVADAPWDVLPAAPIIQPWHAPPGTVSAIGCQRLGELASTLGAGRFSAGDEIDPAVGLEVHVRVGDQIDPARPAVTVHARTQDDADAVLAQLEQVVRVGDGPASAPPLIIDRIGLDGGPAPR